jgi:uncharacterized protein YwqG
MIAFLQGFLEWLLGTAAVLAVIGFFLFLWELVRGRVRWPKPMDPKVVAALRKEIRSLQTYSLYLIPARQSQGMSRFGGVPSFSAGRVWPRFYGVPLGFLAQIDLAQARSANGPEWLPDHGLLLFFYDVEQSSGEPGAVVVLYEPATDALTPFAEPEDLPSRVGKPARYTAKPMRLRRARSWPSFERLKTERTYNEINAAMKSLPIAERPTPNHQIGGYPSTVQWDFMEWECELASRGRGQDYSKIINTPEGDAMKAAVAEWKLLLQLENDEHIGFDWIEGGTLYLWVREGAARAGDFSGVRAEIQYT